MKRLLTSLFLLFQVCSQAAYDGPKWSLLDEKQELAAAAEITPAKYPDSDQVLVDEKVKNVYHTDGTAENQDETYQKVLTEKGKRDSRTLTLSFQLPYSTVEVAKVEVIKPDGRVVPVDVAANSKEMIDDSQMEANIYDPNSKLLKVNIPSLEVGDVVHSLCHTNTTRSAIPGEFADETMLEGTSFIRHLSYEVESPDDRPLKHLLLRDEVPGTVTYTTAHPGEGKITVHHWEVNNVSRMFPEPSMPSSSVVLQRLLISTTPDWATVSKWYWDLSKAHLEAQTPEMKAKVAELTAHTTTPEEKTKAIFYYVSNKIRYMGLTPETDRPGYEPHDVKITFGNKYGVCRDKAALLVSMLRLAGINAYPVLTSYGAKMDQDAPTPFFNHAIVAVDQGKRDYQLMDPTDENTRVLFPSVESDQSYLVARPEGETLLTSAVVPSDENMVQVKTDATLNAEGKVEAKAVIDFNGVNDNAYRSFFSEQKPDDLRRFFEERLKEALPGATLRTLSITPEKMSDVSTNIRVEMEFAVNDMAVSGGGKAIVSLPWIGKKLGIVNFILGGTGLEKRKYPLRTQVACGVREEIALKLDKAFTGAISTPGYAPIHEPFMTYDRDAVYKDGALQAARTLKLNVVEFSPADYLKLKQALQTMAYDDRKAPVLARAGDAAEGAEKLAANGANPKVDSNATVLDDERTLRATDAHAATYTVKYRKKILTYAGKKEDSEIKISYNPAMEDAKIVHATVTTKSGEKKEISKGEINILDAGWNASAKRYTGGKILVANLPAVDVGATIEVEYEIASKGVPYLSDFEAFQEFDDVESESFTINLPKSLKFLQTVSGANVLRSTGTALRQGIFSGPPERVKEMEKEYDQHKDDYISYGYYARHVPALPEEPQLPPAWLFRSGVDYFVGNPRDYLKELRETLLDRSGKNAKAVETAKQITAGAKTKLDALVAVRDFVAKSVRLAGPSFTDLPLQELSAADTTLTDGYGHSADRAILLHAMLTAAGFQPEFMLASTLPQLPTVHPDLDTTPLLDFFTTPLVRVTLDGATYYLNDTDEYAQVGTTPSDGKWGLALNDQTYAVIQAPAGCANKTDSVISLTLNDQGQARITFARQIYGADFNSDKKFVAELTPEERKRYFQQLVSSIAQGARPVGDLQTDFSAYPGKLQYTVEIDNYSVVDGNYMYFDAPYTPSIYPSGADRRSLPLYLSQNNQTTTRLEIALPPAFQKIAIAPQNEKPTVPGTAGSAEVDVLAKDGKFIITDQLDATPALISPQEYPALLKVESTLGNKSAKAFLLEKS